MNSFLTSFRVRFLLIAAMGVFLSVPMLSTLYYYYQKEIITEIVNKELIQTGSWLAYSIAIGNKISHLPSEKQVDVKPFSEFFAEITNEFPQKQFYIEIVFTLQDNSLSVDTNSTQQSSPTNTSNSFTLPIQEVFTVKNDREHYQAMTFSVKYNQQIVFFDLRVQEEYISKKTYSRTLIILEFYIFMAVFILIIYFGIFISLADPFYRIVDVFRKFNYKLIKQSNDVNANDLYLEIHNVKTYHEFNILKNLLIEFIKEVRDIQKDEIDRLLSNINIGLCITDNNLDIGSTYSKEITNILSVDTVKDKNLHDILHPLIINKTKKTAFSGFVDLIKLPSIQDSVLQSVNPLKEVLVEFKNEKENLVRKHLLFDFNFIKNEENQGEREFCIVTIKDNTDIYNLKEQIEKQEKQENEQSIYISRILENSPVTIKEFITNSLKDIQDINLILREDDKGTNAEEVEIIFRIIHNIKGNASILKINSVAEIAHTLEDKLAHQLRESKYDDDIFLEIGIKINNLKLLIENMRQTLESMNVFVNQYFNPQVKGSSLDTGVVKEFIRNLEDFIETQNKGRDKKIRIDHSKFNQIDIVQCFKSESLKFIKDALIQFTRNAVNHGVESIEERKAENKPINATLKLTTRKTDKNIEIIFEDDGRGIDEQRLKKKAEKNGIDVSQMSRDDILNLIFLKGFSTSESVSEVAGRGMGMDIINDAVKKMNGKIKLETSVKIFTRFELIIPL